MFLKQTQKKPGKVNAPGWLISSCVCLLLLQISGIHLVSVYAQQPTLEIPTVTGTPTGVMATVSMEQEFVNVRSGPGIFYDKIGSLLSGQQVPVKGRSVGGDWLYIEYLGVEGSRGWIYAPNVSLTAGSLAIIEPPPTPTPRVTLTIDPTLAAQFVITPIATRAPTYTPAEPITIPTFTDSVDSSLLGKLPMGLIILVLGGFGIVLGIFALIQNR